MNRVRTGYSTGVTQRLGEPERTGAFCEKPGGGRDIFTIQGVSRMRKSELPNAQLLSGKEVHGVTTCCLG